MVLVVVFVVLGAAVVVIQVVVQAIAATKIKQTTPRTTKTITRSRTSPVLVISPPPASAIIDRLRVRFYHYMFCCLEPYGTACASLGLGQWA